MGKVYTSASTSIDGYVCGPEFSGFDKLFRWYEAGDVAFTVPIGVDVVWELRRWGNRGAEFGTE